MGTLWQDIRYATRLLRRNPGLTAVALLTLTLGIGANTAIFSLLNALILRDLPVRDPSHLVAVYVVDRKGQEQGILLDQMSEMARHQQVFTSMCGFGMGEAGFSVLTTEVNHVLSSRAVDSVTGDCFSLLGVRPFLGRMIGPEDVDLANGAPAQVVVISYNFWRQRYSGDPDVVGKTVLVEGLPLTIIGVTPKNYFGLSVGGSTDVTMPLPIMRNIIANKLNFPASETLPMNYVLAWLKPGITIDQARAQVQLLWPGVVNAVPLTPERRGLWLARKLVVKSAANGFSFMREEFAEPLYILGGLAALVLLIACVNIAGLMFARAAARSHEMGVRAAVGASHWRLMRQLLTESVILSASGALLGLTVAGRLAWALANLFWTGLSPLALDLRPDLRVLAFSSGAAILTGVLFGLAPAWRATREDPKTALQPGSRTLGQGANRLGKLLMVTQVALSVVLLTGAGLFIRSLEKLRAIRPGFQTHGILIAQLMPKPGGYQNLDNVSYYHDLIERLSRLPGVQSVSMSMIRPGEGSAWSGSVAPGSVSGESGISANFCMVSPEFFRTMGLSLFQGRTFSWQDDASAPRVAILPESLARQLFPQGKVLGQSIRFSTDPGQQNIQIVGVVSDARLGDLHDPHFFAVFVPEAQEPAYMRWPNFELSTVGDPRALAGAVRQTVESLGHEYPLTMKTVDDVMDESLVQDRVMAMLSGFFGGLALLLAAMGLYGLMAYTVTRRTREIGIRVTLGAQRGGVLWMILRESFLVTFVGIAIGVPCALAGTRMIGHMFFGLSANDPATITFVCFILIAIAVMASYLPARRAMRVDPMSALRNE